MNSKTPPEQISPQRKVLKMFEPWKRFSSDSNNAQPLWGRASRPTTGNLMAHPTRGYLSNCEQTIFENPRPATAPVRNESSRQNTLVQALINNIDKFILQDEKEANLKIHRDELKKTKDTNPFYKIKQEYVTWNSVSLNNNKNEIKEIVNSPESDKNNNNKKFNEVNKYAAVGPVKVNSQENRLVKNPFTCSDTLKPFSDLKSKSHTLPKNHGDCKQTVVVKKSQSRHLCRHCRLRYAVESSEVDDEIEPTNKNSLRKRYRKSNTKQSCHKERSRNKDVETPHLIKSHNKKSLSPNTKTKKRSKSVSSKCSDSSSYKTTVSTASKTRLLQEIGSGSELEWSTSDMDLVQSNSLTLPRETRRATIVMLNNHRRPTKLKQFHVDILEDKNYLINETLQIADKTARICPFNLLCTKPVCHHRVSTRDNTPSSSISEDSSPTNSLTMFKIANTIHPLCSLMLNSSSNHSGMSSNVSNGNNQLVNFN